VDSSLWKKLRLFVRLRDDGDDNDEVINTQNVFGWLEEVLVKPHRELQ
jgi:hypothetical protein